jgi:hypothetical protein
MIKPIDITKYNNDYITTINKELLKYKKYDLERINDITEYKCMSCTKTALYINNKDNQYLCWHHAFLLTKNNI